MAKLTKKKVIDYLKDKDIYNDVDEFLVDELLYNIHLANLAKDDIEERGVVVAINTNGTLMNSNPSVNIYMSATKQVLTIARKLNLDSRSRIELKLNAEVEDDGF